MANHIELRRALPVAGITIFMAEACQTATPNPTATPETATPTPIVTESAMPSMSPVIETPTATIVFPTPTPEVSPTPTPEITPEPTPTPKLKTGEDLISADHPRIKFDKLTADIISGFENNDADIQFFQGDVYMTPDEVTKECGNQSETRAWRTSNCERLTYGLMDTYLETGNGTYFNLTLEAYNYFINQNDATQEEKDRFTQDLQKRYQ